MAELFRQLAFICALIGGFAFAFLGALLTAPSRSRVVEWAAGMALATAADLTICVVGWTLMASQLVTTTPAGAGVFRFPASLNTMHSRLTLLFLVGMVLFLASLGLSGWVRSRLLGVISTAIAILAGVALMFVVSPFLR
ncbi:MAG: hypothetical protein ABUT39_13465 [Acidobacteriota bacterium]